MPKSKDKKAKQSAFSVSYSEGKDNENKNIISKNYSNIVKMLKMSLPSFSIVLVGLVLLWNQIIRETDLFTIGFVITSYSIHYTKLYDIALARIRRLYFGAYDVKGGGVEHNARIFEQASCNHKPEIYGGIS